MHKLHRANASIILANLLDHFDYNLYSFMAPIIAPLFFPQQEPIVQLILAYSFLATSSVARPIGVLIFGWLSSKIDPWKVLKITLIGVGFSTLLMGCLPTFESVGYYAAIMLFCTRVFCNIFAAGEKTVADILIIEDKPYKDAVIANAFFGISIMLGCAFASWIAIVVSPITWRIPFLCGGILSFYALFLRYSHNYNRAQIDTRLVHKENSFVPSLKAVLIVVFAGGLSYVTYDLSFVLINNYVPLVTSIKRECMMQWNSILLIFDAIIIIPIAYLIRQFRVEKVKQIASFMLFISGVPLYYFMQNASLIYVVIVRLWIVILGIVFSSALTIWWIKFFPNKTKYFWIGISSAIGSAIIGRSTSFICLYGWHKTHLSVIPGLYLSAISLIVLLLTFDKKDLEQ